MTTTLIGWKGGELEIKKIVDVKRQNVAYIIEVHLKKIMNTKTSLEATLLNFIHLNILKGEQESTYGSRS